MRSLLLLTAQQPEPCFKTKSYVTCLFSEWPNSSRVLSKPLITSKTYKTLNEVEGEISLDLTCSRERSIATCLEAEGRKATSSQCPNLKMLPYFPRGGGGAPKCNMTGRCPFFKNNQFREKICISIPCFGIFKLLNNRKTIAKTIPYCSLRNSHNLSESQNASLFYTLNYVNSGFSRIQKKMSD